MIQVEQIEEKIAQAPDSGYEIGVVIGSYLPFVILVIIAYAIFYYMKNKTNEQN